MRRAAVVVVLAGIALSACGSARSRPVAGGPGASPAPAAAPEHAAAAKPTAIEAARRAERQGRPGEALGVYERVAAEAGDAEERLAALLGAVRLRLTSDPATRDLRKAQTLLESAEQTAVSAVVPLPVTDLLQLLREAHDLRTQLRAARADLKSLEAEMAKKDEALRRVTSAVVGGKTPQ